ncbi:unnamed protein product [Ixodes pacificus]
MTETRSQSCGKKEGSKRAHDEEPEFHWEDYLEATQSEAVPATAFAHVERSLESGLRPGMKLEVLSEGGPSYWLAAVVTTCGPLLSLRYLGADRAADFWCDLGANEVHPLGWCAQHQRPLRPPQAVRDRHRDWEALLDRELQGAVTVPTYVLEMKGSVPIDQLQEGMKLLVLEEGNPLNGWAASVSGACPDPLGDLGSFCSPRAFCIFVRSASLEDCIQLASATHCIQIQISIHITFAFKLLIHSISRFKMTSTTRLHQVQSAMRACAAPRGAA